MENPFAVQTPETLSPDMLAALFENVFADIPLINQTGHTFIHGPRGSGKSMMFRYLLPEVQKAAASLSGASNYEVKELPFIALHFPIRKQSFQSIDFGQDDQARRITLANHYLAVKVMEVVLGAISDLTSNFAVDNLLSAMPNIAEFFKELSLDYGVNANVVDLESTNVLGNMVRVVERERRSVETYIRTLPLNQAPKVYTLGATTFVDYVVPMLDQLKRVLGKPFLLMIDDADELIVDLQRIINTWVSHRTTDVVSLKISTQLRYATYTTLSGSIIESPHDFSAVNLTQIYTSKVDRYYEKARNIMAKRFQYYGPSINPEQFFPEDKKRKQGIKAEEDEIRRRYETGERVVSSRVADDIYRYSIPNHMARLHEGRKSNVFSYSGFKTLVDLSSGTIRLLLEPAATMFAECERRGVFTDATVKPIPPTIQNQVLREWSEKYYREEIDQIEAKTADELETRTALKNLISGLGELFGRKLLDREASERRVFSIFVDELPDDLNKVISLGVSHGYFLLSSIRSKEKTGRKIEIIFNRRLAPFFYLDPSGYSGRLSVTIEDLKLATRNPKRFVQRRLKIEDIQAQGPGLFDWFTE